MGKSYSRLGLHNEAPDLPKKMEALMDQRFQEIASDMTKQWIRKRKPGNLEAYVL